MAILIFPTGLCPTKFGMQLMGNIKVNESVINGAGRRVEYPGDHWIIRAEFPPMRNKKQFRKYHAFFNNFRGGLANTLRIWALDHPLPYGTMRGNSLLGVDAPYGANSIVVQVEDVNETLLMGDMIGVTLANGSLQLCEVMNEPTGVGGFSRFVNISPPLRWPANSQSAIVWNYPMINCVITAHPFPTQGVAFAEGFTFEARETFLV